MVVNDASKSTKIGDEISTYMKNYHISTLFRNLVAQLVQEKPESPLSFLVERLSSYWAPKIMIVGAPASGKGTQCEMLVQRYGVTYIGTGDLLRAEVAKGSRLGQNVKEYLDSGRLVPDNLIIEVVSKRVTDADSQHNGWIMDGYPRTREQAQALRDLGVEPDLVFFLNLPDEEVEERVTGRWSDPVTGKIYHTKFNPPPANIRSRLVQRIDDSVEKVKVLLDAFHECTEPVLQMYDGAIVHEVDAMQGAIHVSKAIAAVVDELALQNTQGNEAGAAAQ